MRRQVAVISVLAALGSRLAAATPARGATPSAERSGAIERRVVTMGTALDLRVRAATRERAVVASEAAVAEVERLELLLSTWRDDTPLARINAAPVGRDVPLDEELAALLASVFEWSRRTRGAFDPTVAPLIRAWDLRGVGRIPTAAELAAARAAVGLDRFRFDPAVRTIARRDPLASIDEGAWGKGYALDRAAARVRGAGGQAAILDFGGEVLAFGDDGGSPWRVDLAHPRDRRRPLLAIGLPPGTAVSTSGNSERARRVGGRIVGHLLDPHTGEPAPDFGSAVVVAHTGFDADVLSTAFFVLGPEEGLAVSAALRAQGLWNEALFLIDSADALRARASPGWNTLVVSPPPFPIGGPARPKP